MAHVMNARGGLGDEDPRPPPRLPTDVKGKATKMITSKKRKFADVDIARAATMAAASDKNQLSLTLPRLGLNPYSQAWP